MCSDVGERKKSLRNEGERKTTVFPNATPMLLAPASDWRRRIDDVGQDVIAAAAVGVNNACVAVLKGVAGYKTI